MHVLKEPSYTCEGGQKTATGLCYETGVSFLSSKDWIMQCSNVNWECNLGHKDMEHLD
jgi:hypothetical protein